MSGSNKELFWFKVILSQKGQPSKFFLVQETTEGIQNRQLAFTEKAKAGEKVGQCLTVQRLDNSAKQRYVDWLKGRNWPLKIQEYKTSEETAVQEDAAA